MNKVTANCIRTGKKYQLPKINVGDTVLVKKNAKLQWFEKETRNRVLGKIGKVYRKGKFHYAVIINGIEYYFQRLDLKVVI